jgi:glyoxylase-like metal-dependent hydrolase (beta-lactamase superfamily II)
MPVPWDRGFVEVADRVFVARYRAWDVSIGVVVGEVGSLVVDTRASVVQGSGLYDDIRRLPPHREVRWVVNTHEHFDHVLGNAVFTGARVHAHENAAAAMTAAVARIKAAIEADPEGFESGPGITADVLRSVVDSELRLPDVTFSSATAIDLGDRYVELVFPGRGHTAGDLIVHVPDCDVVFAGDLVEESADRDATPYFGEDCFPLEWAPTLDLVMGLLGSDSIVVPGHGAVVDRAFVERQRDDISAVAELVRTLASAGVPLASALAEGERLSRTPPLAVAYGAEADESATRGSSGWPFDPRYLGAAVSRGYQQLRTERRALPIVSHPEPGKP